MAISNSRNIHPFERLLSTQTVSSLARKVATKIPSSPPDSLDLTLASTYDHHAIWGASRAYVVKQGESCVDQHGLNVTGWISKEATERDVQIRSKERDNGSTYKESKSSYRNAAFHVELGIPPHHTSNSRRGYGRSSDGCFYST